MMMLLEEQPVLFAMAVLGIAVTMVIVGGAVWAVVIMCSPTDRKKLKKPDYGSAVCPGWADTAKWAETNLSNKKKGNRHNGRKRN